MLQRLSQRLCFFQDARFARAVLHSKSKVVVQHVTCREAAAACEPRLHCGGH